MRVFRDTWLIFERSLTLSLRNPVWVIMGIIQPILYLLLFGPLLNNIAKMPGFPPGGAFNVFVPGHPGHDRALRLGLRGLRAVRRDARGRRGADAGHAHEPGGDAPRPLAARRDAAPGPGA